MGEAMGDFGRRLPVNNCLLDALGIGDEYLSLIDNGEILSV